MSIEHDVFAHVIDVLERLKIPYMIGGSVASIAYGEPRLTLDMDIVIDIKEDQVEKFIQSFGNEYYVDLNSILEAVKNKTHFNIINSIAGVKVDFYVLEDDEFSRQEFSRRRKEAFDKKMLAYFKSPEDTILKKLQWHKMGGSEKHIEDIKGILKVSGSKLDLVYLDKWAIKLKVADVWQKTKGSLQ